MSLETGLVKEMLARQLFELATKLSEAHATVPWWSQRNAMAVVGQVLVVAAAMLLMSRLPFRSLLCLVHKVSSGRGHNRHGTHRHSAERAFRFCLLLIVRHCFVQSLAKESHHHHQQCCCFRCRSVDLSPSLSVRINVVVVAVVTEISDAY